MLVLRRAPIVHGNERDAAFLGVVGDIAIVRFEIADGPAAAVEIQHRGLRPLEAGGPVDAHGEVAPVELGDDVLDLQPFRARRPLVGTEVVELGADFRRRHRVERPVDHRRPRVEERVHVLMHVVIRVVVSHVAGGHRLAFLPQGLPLLGGWRQC